MCDCTDEQINQTKSDQTTFYNSVHCARYQDLLQCNLVNKANLVHSVLSAFISFLYMLRVIVCPSSGEITVSVQCLVLVILCG